jgi:hypothetical protein
MKKIKFKASQLVYDFGDIIYLKDLMLSKVLKTKSVDFRYLNNGNGL